MLSKNQMREALANGGSVLHPKGLITKPEHLSKIHGTEAEKQSEIEALKARLSELEDDQSEEKPAEGGIKTAKTEGETAKTETVAKTENKSQTAKKSEEKPAEK